MFTGVCLATGGVSGPGGVSGLGVSGPGRGRCARWRPPGWLLLRAVRILLECILVMMSIILIKEFERGLDDKT